MIVATVIGIVMATFFWTAYIGFMEQSISGSANVHLPGIFRTWTFPLNIGLNMLPSDSFMSCLDYLLRYSTRGVQALQRIALAVFGAMD